MQPVERTEVEGVDYGWVMQTTFVVTILVGAPAVALLSTQVVLETWGSRVLFAVRVGAPVWFLTAIVVFAYAKRTDAGDVVSPDSDRDTTDDATSDSGDVSPLGPDDGSDSE
ncbi:DUF5822 domain-containing protein [Halopenitus sp. H-Gu1]|uniref:DUF5822 domain-containing protein n=1 Tax=Halopenitus sp. H-Gu1 TaxID=3242697 RepID=UPI00359D6459